MAGVEELDLSVLRYSRVWEDYLLLYRGLRINSDDVILVITSAGDNVLNLLLKEPKEIFAVDMSVAQNALLELKLASIKHQEYDEFVQLIGEVPSTNRIALYEDVKCHLPVYAIKFWDSNTSMIEDGIVDSGRLEKYVATLSSSPEYFGDPELQQKLTDYHESESLDEQQEALKELPLQLLHDKMRTFCNNQNLAKGRSEEQFKYVQFDVGSMCAARYIQLFQRKALVKDNFYLSLFNRGRNGYDVISKPEFAAPYVRRENFHKLKGLVDKVKLYTGFVDDFLLTVPPKTITKAVLSNIFEYCSVEQTHHIFKQLYQSMEQGGTLVYWELFIPRAPPSDLFIHHGELSKVLTDDDRMFYYATFNVYEVK